MFGLKERDNSLILDDFDQLSRNMDRWFESMMGSWPVFTTSIAKRFAGPTVDVQDKGKDYLVKVDIPGMEKKDIHVSVREGLLEIQGKREEEKKEEDKKKGYYRSERFYGSFHRVVELPGPVDKDKAEARYENGVLLLTLPKSAAKETEGHAIAIH